MDTKIDIGVKYADKQARHFDNEKIKAGQCVIGLQVNIIDSTYSFLVDLISFKVGQLNYSIMFKTFKNSLKQLLI